MFWLMIINLLAVIDSIVRGSFILVWSNIFAYLLLAWVAAYKEVVE